MTTEVKRSGSAHGGSALLGAALTALALGIGTALVGVLVSGSSALLGALIGTAIIIGVFGTGALAVDLISRTMPTLSLLVDRKSVVSGKSVSVRVDLGGCRIIKQKKKQKRDHDD